MQWGQHAQTKLPVEGEDEVLVLTPKRKAKNNAHFADKTCWNCSELGHINHYCPKPKKARTPTFVKTETAGCMHIEDCEGTFGLECVSDDKGVPRPMLISASSISDNTNPDESVPHSDMTPDTSVEDFGSVPDLESVSESFVTDELSEDNMEVDRDPDFLEDLTAKIPELEDNVDWSAVRAFQNLSLRDKAAVLDHAHTGEASPWIKLLDSGCTRHISPYKEDFTSLNDIVPKPFQAANKQQFSATAQGELKIDVPNRADTSKLQLHEVLYSLEVGYTLILVGKLDDLGFDIHFHGGTCTICTPNGTQVAHIPKDKNGLYWIMHDEGATHTVETISLDQLHRRMGHISPETACKMVQKGFVAGVRLDTSSGTPSFCESCVYTKVTRKSVQKEREGTRATDLGDEICSDIWGPALVETIRSHRYYISFINDMSCLIHISLLCKKSETPHAYKEFEARLQTKYGKGIKCLNSDHGGDYMGKAFTLHLKEQGTYQKLNVHNTPQHAGVLEHFNRTALKKVCAMLHSSGLPRSLWGEALSYAIWVINCMTTQALNNMTPLEAATGGKPDLSGLHKWG
jgi:hypothetical protein